MLLLASDQPLSNYTVRARPVDTVLPMCRTETSNDGSFNFKALSNGIYLVEVPRRAFIQEVEIEGTTKVELSVGEHSLSGQLRALKSVLNAEVRLIGGPEDRKLEWGIRDVVDASGNFSFEGLSSGSYTIVVTHQDYAENLQKVEVNHDVEDFDIYLQEAATE